MTSSESSASNRGFSLSRAALDALELEVAGAQRSETNDLYHYTNANVAMYNILASGTLRLSPFESTNDLWESRPLHPNLSSHHDDKNWPEGSGHMDLWADIDRNIRLHAKVVCLTRDFTLPDHVWNWWRRLLPGVRRARAVWLGGPVALHQPGCTWRRTSESAHATGAG